MLSQSRVDHRPIGREEFADRQVIREDRGEERGWFDRHAFFQPQVVVRIELRVGREHADSMQLQPLMRERTREASDLRVGQHAVELLAKRGRFVQLARRGGNKQRVVRHRTPQEIRQPRRQLPIVDLVAPLGRRAFFEVIEILRREHAGHRGEMCYSELLAGSQLTFDDAEEASHLDVGDGPPPRACRQSLEAFARLGQVALLRRHQAFTLLEVRVSDYRLPIQTIVTATHFR